MSAHPTTDPEIDAAAAAARGPDPAARQRGIATLLHRGGAAIPALLALATDTNPAVRVGALHALAELADPAGTDVLLRALDDTDSACRAQAARGLFRLGHPGALDAALRTLDDGADELHADMTPSVRTLGAIGLPAVAGILDRMMADAPMTRLHAQRALEAVLDARHGFVPGRGYPSPADEAARRAEWQSRGAYRYDAPEAARAAAVASWRKWLAGAAPR